MIKCFVAGNMVYSNYYAVSGGSGGDCTNKVSTTKCNRWARQGDCTNRYPKDYTAWMAKHCKKSCGC